MRIEHRNCLSVASLSNGKFVVTWRSVGQDGDAGGIYGQIFNADRTKNGSEFQVNTYTIYKQNFPSVTSLSNDKFVITWQSNGQDGDVEGVYGQVFNADGTKNGPEFQVNTYTTSSQGISSIASLSNDKFVITWQSYFQDGDVNGVFGQLFNADGTKNGSEFQVNTYTTNKQHYSSVASLSNNKFVITWFSEGQDGSSNGIFGQMFNADGTKNGLEFPVNTYTINSQEHPSVTNLNNNGFVITWGSYGQDGSSYGIYGQLFNEDGTKNGLEFPVNTYTTNSQQAPSAVSLNNDKFVITWQSNGQDGSSFGIYGQTFRLPSITTTSSTTSSRTSSSSSRSLTSSSSTRSSSSSSSKSSSSRVSTRSDSASTVSTIDVSTKETKTIINSASISNALPSITSIATQNIFTTKSSSNSTKRTWIISAIIGAAIIIPASILAFFKLKKKKSQNPSTIEMQNNDPERALQELPQIDQHPSSQDLSQAQEEETDEEPIYAGLSQFPIQSLQGGQEGQEITYSKLLDVALAQEKQDAENQYAQKPIREDF